MDKPLFSLQASSPGREKEGELATGSLEFEYLLWKSRREMLIWPVDNFLKTASIFYSLESYSGIWLLNYWDLESRDMLI